MAEYDIDLGIDPAEEAAIDLALDDARNKAPISVHHLALELSDIVFGLPSEQDYEQRKDAELFVDLFLNQVPLELLELQDKEALFEHLKAALTPCMDESGPEALQATAEQVLRFIELQHAQKYQTHWDKLAESTRKDWERRLRHGGVPAKAVANEYTFTLDALSVIRNSLPESDVQNSIAWREGGTGERMLENMYVLAAAEGANLDSMLSRLQSWTDTKFSEETRTMITQVFLEEKLREPNFITVMAMPNMDQRLDALGPIADKLMKDGRAALKTALEQMDAAYDATKQFSKEQRANAIAKWGLEHVQNFERSMVLLGMLTAQILSPQFKNVADYSADIEPTPVETPLDAIKAANEKMGEELLMAEVEVFLNEPSEAEEEVPKVEVAALKPDVKPAHAIEKTIKDISLPTTAAPAKSWAEKVGKKSVEMHEKISAKVAPLPEKIKLEKAKFRKTIDSRPSKNPGAYMDKATVEHTSQRLTRCKSDKEMLDIYMDKWIWKVEAFKAYSYGDRKVADGYPDGYPTIGLGFNMVRGNADKTAHDVLGWSKANFYAHLKNYRSESTAGKTPITKAEAVKLARHDIVSMLSGTKRRLGNECWSKLNWHQKFTALDLYYNNSTNLMGDETVALFQEAARTGDFEKLALAIADKRNASNMPGSNLRRQTNAEFLVGHHISLKSPAMVDQVIKDQIPSLKNGAVVAVEVSDASRAPRKKDFKKYIVMPEGKKITFIPVVTTIKDGKKCEVQCGEEIELTGTGNGVMAEAIPLTPTTLQTGFVLSAEDNFKAPQPATFSR